MVESKIEDKSYIQEILEFGLDNCCPRRSFSLNVFLHGITDDPRSIRGAFFCGAGGDRLPLSLLALKEVERLE
jgi:hypothetical protein